MIFSDDGADVWLPGHSIKTTAKANESMFQKREKQSAFCSFNPKILSRQLLYKLGKCKTGSWVFLQPTHIKICILPCSSHTLETHTHSLLLYNESSFQMSALPFSSARTAVWIIQVQERLTLSRLCYNYWQAAIHCCGCITLRVKLSTLSQVSLSREKYLGYTNTIWGACWSTELKQ